VSSSLISPHGGELVDLMAGGARSVELRDASREWPSWDLTPRQACDLELLMSGAFSPLRGFMTEPEYESVCGDMRLPDHSIWPMPIVLDVTEEFAKGLESGSRIALRDPEGVMVATLGVSDLFTPDKKAEAERVYGTSDVAHPGVAHLLNETNPVYVGGRVEGAQPLWHFDFRPLRLTPAELRREFEGLGWSRVLAFQTGSVMHRAHMAITLEAVRRTRANLLVHPVVGRNRPERLALLPLAMRMAGPREALWHAIIRKNYGCTHLIVGPDHASPAPPARGKPFYGAYDAQNLIRQHEEKVGVSLVPFKRMVYAEDHDRYQPFDEVEPGVRTLTIDDADLRERLAEDREIPTWFTFPEVARELRNTHPPRYRQGFTVFFTGLSGSGKSTVANALRVKLLEMGGRPVTLLDGDVVRKNLSSELGFSKEHRDLNIRRIGFVASEITKNSGIAICAPIAPYDRIRGSVRKLIEPLGGFVLVHVATARAST